jgi:hypothetical protein
LLDRFLESPSSVETSHPVGPVYLHAEAAPALLKVVEGFLETLDVGAARVVA